MILIQRLYPKMHAPSSKKGRLRSFKSKPKKIEQGERIRPKHSQIVEKLVYRVTSGEGMLPS